MSFVVSGPGDYRLSIEKRICDDDIRIVIRLLTHQLPAATGEEWVELERRFEEGEDLRLRYQEHASRKAVRLFEEVASDAMRARAFRLSALAKQRQGLVLETLGELETAEACYLEAVRVAESAVDLQASMLSSLGLAETMLGQADEGLHHCEEALARSRDRVNVHGEADALHCLAEVFYHRGDLRGALDTHARALPLARSARDHWLEARTLLNMAYSQSDLSQLEEAEDNYRRSLELWERLDEKRFKALTLIALGRLFLRLGENQNAVDHFEEAMRLIDPMGDDVWKASILAGFGEVSFKMGLNDRAVVHYEDTLELFRSAGLRMAVVEVLFYLGEVLLASGRSEEALNRLTEALDLSRELGIARWEAVSLGSIGTVHRASGEMNRALEFYRLALAKLPEDALRYRALILNALGAAYRDLSQPAPAVDAFTKALELSRASADRFQEASSLYYLAEAAASAGDLVAARADLERAIELAESLRGRVLSRDLRASYLASVHDYYELYIDVLMRASAGSESLIEEAFRVSERARARSLLESLAESRIDFRKGVEEDLLARELRVRELYNAKALREMELLEQGGDKAQLDPLENEMALLSAEYDRIQSQIRSESPNFATLTQPQPSTIQEIQGDLLDDESLLLEFALGKERSFLWVVSNKGVSAATLPARSEIEGRARRLYELLTTRQRQGDESPSQWRRQLQQADFDYAREARELGRILLGPAESEIRQHDRLIIAAEGALQYVPFGALPLGGDEGAGPEDVPLILRHQVVRAPSASVVAAIRRARKKQPGGVSKIAVFADPVFGAEDSRIGTRGAQFQVQEELAPLQLSMPRLAATRLEAEAIQSVAPAGSVLLATGLEASRERVMDPGLGDYDVVHFATHGILNDERPELSGIALSMVDERGLPRDGFLRLHDIYNFALPAELVVLSACDTALGKLLRGEGLVGLVRGFMYAGAPRVVASLWKVDDEATKELMTLFYKHLFSEDMDAAAALRAAQISLLQDEDFRHPFYWAAFELHGDWR